MLAVDLLNIHGSTIFFKCGVLDGGEERVPLGQRGAVDRFPSLHPAVVDFLDCAFGAAAALLCLIEIAALGF